MPVKKRKGRRRGYEFRKEGKSGKERRGRRREEGEGTKHRDGEIGIEKCIRVRVCFSRVSVCKGIYM